jgi:F-type H+-transporting ATPase subunit a
MTGVTAQTWTLAQATEQGQKTGTDGDAAAPLTGTPAGHGAAGTGTDAPGTAPHGTGIDTPGVAPHGTAIEDAAGGAAHGGGGGIDPMHQFEIKRIIDLRDTGFDFLSFTNASLFMLLAVGLVSGFFIYSMREGSLVPNRIQSTAEMAYEFVAKMVRDNTGSAGMVFFPFIFTLFIFILTLNMLGMVPYAFTVTSHIIITFALALFVFILVTIVGFIKNGAGFLRLFVPSGAPVVLLPLLIVIEAISYFIRPISLSVRLFANMMAGHVMLKVFAGFVVGLGVLAGWAPLFFMVALTGLEILIAFLQAFVFAVLTCIYLNDALHMHD